MLQSFQRPQPVSCLSAKTVSKTKRDSCAPGSSGRFSPAPSRRPGKMLARTMASYVDPRIPGPVIELGPGTGPVTEALIRRGVAQDRLVLVEFNPEFCQLLKRRFPKATIIQGDAYDLRETLSGSSGAAAARCRACRSSPNPWIIASICLNPRRR